MKRRSFLKSLLGVTSAIISPVIAAKAVLTKEYYTVSQKDQPNPDNLSWKWETVLDDRVRPVHLGFDPAKPGEDYSITFIADKEGHLMSDTTLIPSRPFIKS